MARSFNCICLPSPWDKNNNGSSTLPGSRHGYCIRLQYQHAYLLAAAQTFLEGACLVASFLSVAQEGNRRRCSHHESISEATTKTIRKNGGGVCSHDRTPFERLTGRPMSRLNSSSTWLSNSRANHRRLFPLPFHEPKQEVHDLQIPQTCIVFTDQVFRFTEPERRAENLSLLVRSTIPQLGPGVNRRRWSPWGTWKPGFPGLGLSFSTPV